MKNSTQKNIDAILGATKEIEGLHQEDALEISSNIIVDSVKELAEDVSIRDDIINGLIQHCVRDLGQNWENCGCTVGDRQLTYKQMIDLISEEKEWKYLCSSSTMWSSFDNGVVMARTYEEALEKSTVAIERDLCNVNKTLNGEFTIEMDTSELTVTLVK